MAAVRLDRAFTATRMASVNRTIIPARSPLVSPAWRHAG